MGFEITNIEDILSLWAENPKMTRNSTEIHTSCPFCPPDDGTVTFNGVTFTGDDRFILNNSGAFCRYCMTQGRKRHYTFDDIAERLAVTLSTDFARSVSNFNLPARPPELLNETQIQISHADVDRKYWSRFGWSNDVVNYFRLGLREIYPSDGAAHIIPFKIRHEKTDKDSEGFFVEARVPNAGTKRMRGKTSQYFWLIHDDPSSTSVVITEGAKDAISAWVMGFRNVAAIFGTTVWSDDKALSLKRAGFTHIISAGDNDPAGGIMNREVSFSAKRNGMEVSVLNWQEQPAKFDLTNLLETLGQETARNYLISHLQIPDISSVQYLLPPDSFEPEDYDGEREEKTYLHLSEIRGDGSRSLKVNIKRFVDGYTSNTVRGYGALLLLNASPGTGKTHTLVNLVEPIAEARKAKVTQERTDFLTAVAELQQELEQATDRDEREALRAMIEKYQRRLADLSNTSVLWVAKFKESTADLMTMAQNPDLWFDFQRRSPDNCENFGLTQELGQKNHEIRAYCEQVCPFRDKCKMDGYLSQEQKMKEKSITIVRHQHLVNDNMISLHPDLVVIDESPLETVESPMLFQAHMLNPFTRLWWAEIDSSEDNPIIQSAMLLTRALMEVLKTTVDDIGYYGTRFFDKLDSIIKYNTENDYDLDRVMGSLDNDVFSKYYQPTYIASGAGDIFVRSMPFLFPILADEYSWYISDKSVKRPSRIHTYYHSGLDTSFLEIRQMKRPKIRSTTPIIVADATTNTAELYASAFKRQVDVYAPETQNPNLEEHVFYGKDFTKAYRKKHFGKLIADKSRIDRREIVSVTGEKFQLDNLELSEDTYDNVASIDEYFDVISHVATMHSPTLVVTHLDVQKLLEPVFRRKFPELSTHVAWAHYWSLRGKNTYKDYKSAILFGVPREPYTAMWRRVQAWAAFSGRTEDVPYEFQYNRSPYGNHALSNQYRTFTNKYAQFFVDMAEKGEIQQCAERIRPHVTEEHKHIYYVMTRPMDAKNVMDVQSIRTVITNWRQEAQQVEVIQHIVNTKQTTGRMPTINEIRRTFHLQHPMAKSATEKALIQLG